MSEVHHKAETQDVRPMTDCIGGGLDEGADTQDTHDPGRRTPWLPATPRRTAGG